MTEIIEKGILLGFDELRVLLYGMGIAEIRGVYMPEKIFSETEVITSLHRLSESGYIIAEEEKFIIREDIKYLLHLVAHPDGTDIWKPRGEEGPSFFLYFADNKVVVSERFWRKKDTLRFTLFENKDFEVWRNEYLDDNCGN